VVSAAEERGQSLAELIGEALSTYLGLSGDRPTLREEVETLRRDVELLKRKLTGW
jgi:ubiquinone biosynthesis protein UbiJ